MLPPLPVRAPHEAERLADFAAALRPRLSGPADALRPPALRMDALHRALYATDASLYQIPPVGVLLPRTTDDVQAAIEEAARFDIPVVPRGCGSSLAGSAVGAGLVIDTTRHLDAVLDLDVEARTVRVQAGVMLDALNRMLAAHGLTVGPDPASSNRATIGGMVGTNATGTHSILYGSTVDHVREARALLADGSPATLGPVSDALWAQRAQRSNFEGRLYADLDALLRERGDVVRRDTPRHWRRAGGYRLERLTEALDAGRERSLAPLLCGSEGTLAFATEVTLGLVERPPRTALGVVHFDGRLAALEAVETILATDPAAVELFDQISLRRARQVADYAPRLHFVQGDPVALLIVEYFGESAAELSAKLDGLERALKAAGQGRAITRCSTPQAINDVWTVRKVGLGLAMSARLPIQALAFIEDAAVPVEHLPAYIRDLEGVMQQEGVEAVMYAHASAGCLHVRPFLDTKDTTDVARMARIGAASADLVKRYDGIIASEHGDGIARAGFAETFYGRELYECYRAVKRAFDPDARLNPGKVTDAPPMTEHLRLGPDYHPQPVATELSFLDQPTSGDGAPGAGFAAAIEACNGSGVCRKRDVGTMCPTFMATREEKDSTRGRANALRMALTGAFGPDGLTGPEVADAMDLCIGCKACVAECPAQVDLTKLKTEWLAQRWRKEKPSLRTRLFAHLPDLAPLAAGPQAAAANAFNKLGVVRRQLEKRLGVARERSLPAFATKPYRKADPQPAALDPERHVALYADSFARYFDPDIARAAERVLTVAGFEVVVPPYRCCGRTLLSKGFVPQARKKAAALVETLHPYAAAGVAVVGLEPSCILTLRDELPALLPDDPRAAALAGVAQTFEEWVTVQRTAGRLDGLAWQPDERPVYVHGHCHQKALSSFDASRTCLTVAGDEVHLIDAGCCGVAGAFGYEAEHYAVSRAVGEDRLGPAVRAATSDQGGDAVIAAAGTSCRAQIEHLTGREALHPAQVLARRLA